MTSNSIDLVVSHYRLRHPFTRNGGKEARDLIAARMREGYTVEQLKLAIDGCHAHPWNTGKDKKSDGTPHQGLDLIFKTQGQVVRFMDFAVAEKRVAGEQKNQSAVAQRKQEKRDSEVELELRLALEHKWGGWFDGLGGTRLAELVQKAVPDSQLRAAMPRNLLRYNCLEYLEQRETT